MTSIIATLSYSPTCQSRGSQYGKKLTTDLMASVRNGGARKHRVYVTRYGNAGSAWFTHKGIRYTLPDTAEVDIPVLCEVV